MSVKNNLLGSGCKISALHWACTPPPQGEAISESPFQISSGGEGLPDSPPKPSRELNPFFPPFWLESHSASPRDLATSQISLSNTIQQPAKLISTVFLRQGEGGPSRSVHLFSSVSRALPAARRTAAYKPAVVLPTQGSTFAWVPGPDERQMPPSSSQGPHSPAWGFIHY